MLSLDNSIFSPDSQRRRHGSNFLSAQKIRHRPENRECPGQAQKAEQEGFLASEGAQEGAVMIFAVDFDGTIVEDRFPEIGPMREDAICALNRLQWAGHKIIIWTCRCGEYLDAVKAWFLTHDFEPDAYNENPDTPWQPVGPKVYADVYLDDRSFPSFTNWQDVIAHFVDHKELDDYF